MSEREKDIIQELSESFPALKHEDQKYVLGIVEGMAMMAKSRDGAGRQLQEA